MKKKEKLPEQEYILKDGSKTKFSDYLQYSTNDERYTSLEMPHTKLPKKMYYILKLLLNKSFKDDFGNQIYIEWDDDGYIKKSQLTTPLKDKVTNHKIPKYKRGLIDQSKFRQYREVLKGYIEEDYQRKRYRLYQFGLDLVHTRLIFYQFYINGELELLVNSDYYKNGSKYKQWAYQDSLVWILNQKILTTNHPADRIKKY